MANYQRVRNGRARRLGAAALLGALGLIGLPGLAGAAGSAGATRARAHTAPGGMTQVADGTGGLTAGMAVPDLGRRAVDAEFRRFRADGGNAVSIFVWWMARGEHADSLVTYDGTLSDAALRQEIADARRVGLAVSLTPVFYCYGCEGGWRGTLHPQDPEAFFAAYRAFVDHYASLAAGAGVSTFYAGSEMTSLEDRTADWRQVLASVRARFAGTVAYEENWDVLGRAAFLSQVDLVGVSAYFPLDAEAEPNLARLLGDWHSSASAVGRGRDWVAELASLAHRVGRPIVFGEVGYMSGDYAGRQPFLDFGGQADWQLQADLYQALLETFSGQPWWRGVVWWQWFAPPGSSTGSNAALTTDNSRTPQAKTAEALLRDWYARGWRPERPTDPLTLLAAGALAHRHPAAARPQRSSVTLPTAPGSGARPLAAGVPGGPAAPLGGDDPVRRHEVGLLGLVALFGLIGSGGWLALRGVS